MLNPFKIFSPNNWLHKSSHRRHFSKNNQKNINNTLFWDENFVNLDLDSSKADSYLCNAWVNIAINILIRNLARADFVLECGGEELKKGPLYDLFHRPNKNLSRYDLWKETAAWWHLEGEAFWWFGPDYSGGLPKDIFILNPRRLQIELTGGGGVYDDVMTQGRRWFYQCGHEQIPIFSDELIHFKDWNPWNPLRGVNPLVSLALELEQDYFANKANSTLNNKTAKGMSNYALLRV